MKVNFWTVVIVILIILVIVGTIVVIKNSSKSQPGGGAYGGGFSGGGNNNGGNTANGSTQGNGGNTTTPTISTDSGYTPPPTVPTLANYIGKSVVAPYNGTKVYFGTNLSLAKTYNKGEFIGHLGEEAINNIICGNFPGYYRIIDTGIQQQTVLGFYIDAPCEVVMPKSVLNMIFGIA